MGKSPGKWIKTVLFGKKNSKSHLSKHAASDKNVKTPLEDPDTNQALISDPVLLTKRDTDSFEIEKDASDSPCDDTSLHPPNQGVDSPINEATVQVSDSEMRRQAQATTKVQAAFRGYLARRAFRALMGIIRLQALIRGHLVRRQAVSTLCCMRAIVQFQALARGRNVRQLDARRHRVLVKLKLQDADREDNGTNKFLAYENPNTNAFVRKLVIAVPNAMPLALSYESSEPNSAWNWLERWSLSRFWAHPAGSKKTHPKSKPHRKQSGSQIAADVEHVKSKRTIRKISVTGNGDNGALSSFEMDKLKRNPRKVSTNQTESTHDQPLTELERVKHNLRKVSALAGSEESEQVPVKLQPIQSVETATSSSSHVASEQEIAVSSSENLYSSDVVVETAENEPTERSHETPNEILSTENSGKVESTQILEDACKEELSSGTKGSLKIRKRRSLPTKLEYAEKNISPNSKTLPSYMAATESAKAKLRAQGFSSKFGEDGAEQGYARHRSLSSASTNGKLSSLSPRTHKPAQANGIRGSNKTNRSLTTSRDDKELQTGWRK